MLARDVMAKICDSAISVVQVAMPLAELKAELFPSTIHGQYATCGSSSTLEPRQLDANAL